MFFKLTKVEDIKPGRIAYLAVVGGGSIKLLLDEASDTPDGTVTIIKGKLLHASEQLGFFNHVVQGTKVIGGVCQGHLECFLLLLYQVDPEDA